MNAYHIIYSGTAFDYKRHCFGFDFGKFGRGISKLSLLFCYKKTRYSLLTTNTHEKFSIDSFSYILINDGQRPPTGDFNYSACRQ